MHKEPNLPGSTERGTNDASLRAGKGVHPRIWATIGTLGLNDKETAVVHLLMTAPQNVALAKELHISPAMARTRLQSVFSKCNVNSRMELLTMIVTKTIVAMEKEYDLADRWNSWP